MADAIASAKGALYVQDSDGEQSGTGTIAATAGAATVTGAGTAFDTELAVGDLIYHAGSDQLRMVTVITSATSITVDTDWDTTIAAGQSFKFFDMEQVTGMTAANLPNLQAAQIDVSTLDTTGFRKKISGLIDAGAIDGTLFFTPQDTAHKRIYDFVTDGGNKAWTIWIPDASDGTAVPDLKNSRFYFRASVNTFGGEIPLDGAIQASISLLITGKPILKEGS